MSGARAGQGEPLAGIQVVEVGDSPAVGFAGRVLAELGASVTVLEPEGGSALRGMPPFSEGESAVFAYLTAGKRIGTVTDFDDPGHYGGRNIILRDRIDSLEWRSIIETVPFPETGRAIVASTSYGSFGPKCDWAATELTIFHGAGEGWVMPSGLPYREHPDRPPIRIGHYIGNYQAGLTCALSAIAGVRRSRIRGSTEWIDVSTQEAQISLNFMGLRRFLDGAPMETRANRGFRYGGVLPCRDGHVVMLTIEHAQWERLRVALGDPEWARDQRFQDPLERARFGSTIDAHLYEWAAQRTVHEAVAELRGADIPCGPYLSPEELPESPQMQHRRFFHTTDSGRRWPGHAWIVDPAKQSPDGAEKARRRGSAEVSRLERPLSGLRLVDFTSHAAGPYGGEMLALLGCETIRVESNERIDITRRSHPVYGRLDIPTFDPLSGHKRSITLNLKSEEGIRLAKELVAVSDIVIENFRPGVMQRLGLGWETLSEVNPALVMVSLSANGQTGPEARLPGYAPMFAAEGGLGFMTGYRDGAPGELRNNMDHMAGLMSATVAAALMLATERSGRGRYGDVSAREVASMFVGECIIAGQTRPSERCGNDHETWSPHGVYRAAGGDRWVAIAIRDGREWESLCELIARPEWATELADASGRRKHRQLVDAAIERWTTTRDCHEVAEALQARGIPAEASMSAEDLVNDAHLIERRGIVELTHPKWGTKRTVEAPWRFADVPQGYVGWSPELGEHNEEIVCGLLGHDREQLEHWRREKVVH